MIGSGVQLGRWALWDKYYSMHHVRFVIFNLNHEIFLSVYWMVKLRIKYMKDNQSMLQSKTIETRLTKDYHLKVKERYILANNIQYEAKPVPPIDKSNTAADLLI